MESVRPPVATAMLAMLVVPAILPAQQRWAVAPNPSATIGEAAQNARHQFERIDDVLVLPDGQFVVLDGQAPAVRMYSAAGRWVRDLGRVGDGPGEYREPISIATVPDGIGIVDREGRFETVSLEGRPVRSARVPMDDIRDEGFTLLPVRPLADGTVLMRAQERVFGKVRGEYRQQAGLFRASGGRVIDSLGWFVDDSGRTDRSGVPVPRPYLPATGMLVATSGDRIAVITADRPTITVLDLQGRRVARWEVPPRPSRVLPADLERVRNFTLRGFSGNELRVVREWETGRPVLNRAPMAAGILLSTSRPGEVWIERWGRPNGGAVWQVFRISGGIVAEVELPRGVELMAVGRDYIVGITRDEDDVETVVRHTLQATTPN